MSRAKDIVDASNVIYRGSGTVGSADYQQDKDNRSEGYDLGNARGGGGGLPWFRRATGPSSSYPTGTPNYTNPSPVEPYEPQGPPAPEGGAGGTGLFAGMSARDIAALVAALGSTLGGALSKPANTNPSSATTDPAMMELVKLMQGRLQKSEPMFDSVQAMANGMLPTAYQNGGKG